MTYSRHFLLLSVSMVSLLASCSLAPDMKKPDMTIPVSYKEAGNWIKATPENYQLDRNWWKAFNNPTLDGLQDKVANGNQDLKVALARLDEAHALADVSASGLFPAISLEATPNRLSSSDNVANARSNSLYNDYLLNAQASYEIDLWGRVRNQVRSSKKHAEASADELATAELSIRAELARDYFILCSYDESQRLLDQTVKSYEKAYDLTKHRHEGGVATESDVSQAETQLNNAKTRAADMHLKRTQMEHAIAVLVGEMPSVFTVADQAVDMNPPELVPDLPARLMQRRPDIASAERLMEAANADIGVARAAYFPDLALTGEFGFESAVLRKLVEAPSMLWSFGADATMPLFDGGRVSGLSHAARARYDQSVAGYKQTVLVAYRDVEDNLTALHQLDSENTTQQAATKAAEKTLNQVRQRYQGGVTNYLDVVVAENTALDAEIQRIDIRTQRMLASIDLIKALGGGWQAEDIAPATPAKAAK